MDSWEERLLLFLQIMILLYQKVKNNVEVFSQI